MLKIKKGIPLRILFSYGFSDNPTEYYKWVASDWEDAEGVEHEPIITIDKKTKEINIYDASVGYVDLDTIYDLIEDGLVEKVE